MNINAILVPLFAAVVLIGSFSVAFGEEEPACDAEGPCDEEPVCDEDAKGPCCDLEWTEQGATIVKIEAEPGQALASTSPWHPAAVGEYLPNGSRVMCLDNCTMIIAFDDGCWYELKENEMLTIDDVSPCCAAVFFPPVATAATGSLAPGLFAAGIGILAVTDVGAGESTTIELPPEEELPPVEPASP